jgi:electron transfer flavoprotein beta subunit
MSDGGLRIVVGVKWVPNTTNVRFDPKTGALIREGVPSIINPWDIEAVDLALELRDKYGGEVIALSMAPPQAVEGLEHVLGRGVDRAVLVTDRIYAAADTLATSYVLANAVRRIAKVYGDVDLIVFGQETIDSSTAHIGAQTASWLDLPYLYYVRKVEVLDRRSILVERWLEEEIDTYELPLPCVIAAAMRSREARPVSLKNKIRAKLERPIDIWSNKVMGLNPACVGLKGSPTIVAKVTWQPEIPRKREVFEGSDPQEAAQWLVDRLLAEGVLRLEGGE